MQEIKELKDTHNSNTAHFLQVFVTISFLPSTSKLSPTTHWLMPDLDRCSLLVETIPDLDRVQVTAGVLPTPHLICLHPLPDKYLFSKWNLELTGVQPLV